MLLTVDGLAGGAWIGANGNGLVVCLLNRTVVGDRPPGQATISRGMIVPEALNAESASDVRGLIGGMNLHAVQPFTVMAADLLRHVILSWNGIELQTEPASDIRCSSGLGDALVDGPRRSAWSEGTKAGATAAQQDAWHRSRYGTFSPAWVLMSRPGARTVSRNLIEIDPRRIRLEDRQLDATGAEITFHAVEIPR